MKLKNYSKEISAVLPRIKKPITYTGNEIGAVHKTPEENTIRIAMAFPDLYEVAMCHIGTKILYGLLNEMEDVWCERVYAPWQDMEEQMVENGIPLYGLESMDPVKNFDMIGFSLQYEMSYTNVLNMLSLAHIPLRSAARGEEDPIIMAGGPCVYNPEPIAPFIDVFFIGEAEESHVEFMELYRQKKAEGWDKETFLLRAAGIEGIYVPRFYTPEYNADGTLKSFLPTRENVPEIVKKRYIRDLDTVYYPKTHVVSYTQTVHDRLSYEIFRGCPHGCRFCQAGQIYKPVREKSKARIQSDIDCLLRNTGYEEVSLASLSSGDYSEIELLIGELIETYKDERVGVSLPSLRVDALSIEMLREMEKVRKGGITLAPEAGTQRLRDIINKNVTEEALIETVSLAFKEGWGRIKLYFMMGLPGECEDDLTGIAVLADKVVDAYFAVPKEKRCRSVQVVVSTSCFVPKPFTAFQWAGQNTQAEFREKQDFLKKAITNRKVKYNWHDGALSYLEAVFARGDRRLAPVLQRAWELGCKFDSWNEHFSPEKWQQAFEETSVDGDFYALRARSYDEKLPWDFIDIGVSKDYLMREAERAKTEQASRNCKNGCENCGIQNFGEGWQCHGQNTRAL